MAERSSLGCRRLPGARSQPWQRRRAIRLHIEGVEIKHRGQGCLGVAEHARTCGARGPTERGNETNLHAARATVPAFCRANATTLPISARVGPSKRCFASIRGNSPSEAKTRLSPGRLTFSIATEGMLCGIPAAMSRCARICIVRDAMYATMGPPAWARPARSCAGARQALC